MTDPGPRVSPAGILVAALTVCGLALSCFIASRLMFVYPPPWPDEALFSDVAARFVHTGALGTDLYREALPSTRQHFFMTPPLYLLLLAGLFRLTGPGLLPLRFLSAGIGCIVLILTYGIARRSGFGRTLALGAVAVLTSNVVFFRGAVTGRMDGMCLALVLLTLWLALGGAGRPEAPHAMGARARGFALGCLAGLALTTHPLGAVALPVALLVPPIVARQSRPTLAGERARPTPGHARWGEAAWPVLLGFAVCVLPWGLYILQDVRGFALQVGYQASGRFLNLGVSVFLSQWVLPGPIVWITLLAGLAGLLLSRNQGAGARCLWGVQLLLLAAAVIGCEGWYAIYPLPLTAIGLARMVAYANARPLRLALLGAGSAALVGLLPLSEIAPLGSATFSSSQGQTGVQNYYSWCRQIERVVPAGATVLLDCVPAPSFGLTPGRNEIRFHRPGNYALPPSVEREGLSVIDYVVAGREIPDRILSEWVKARARSTVPIEVGALYARVIRVR